MREPQTKSLIIKDDESLDECIGLLSPLEI
jgi:hypothetical protein